LEGAVTEFLNFEEASDGHIIVRVRVGPALGARLRAIIEARVATLPGSSINGELKNWLQQACDHLIAKARKAQPGNKDVANTPEAAWLAIPTEKRAQILDSLNTSGIFPKDSRVTALKQIVDEFDLKWKVARQFFSRAAIFGTDDVYLRTAVRMTCKEALVSLKQKPEGK
jgi:hypothetical protein